MNVQGQIRDRPRQGMKNETAVADLLNLTQPPLDLLFIFFLNFIEPTVADTSVMYACGF